MDCVVADPRDLEHRAGPNTLIAAGQPVDVVYRRVLVADILERAEDCHELIAAYRAGAICMVNSLRTVLLHGKGLFALLHSRAIRERLPRILCGELDRHVPWTALVGDEPGPCTPPGLLERARTEREQLVLKPLTGHGGTGVVLGWEVDQSTWEQALESADGHVVQRRVPAQTLPFPDATKDWALEPRLVDLAPFLVRGRPAGFLCRLSEGALANVTSGATQVPVFALPDGAGAEYSAPPDPFPGRFQEGS